MRPLQRSKWDPPLSMIRAIQHNWARSYASTIAALEIVVDRKPDLVHLHAPPGEKGKIGISHPAYEIRKRKRDWE